MTWKVTTKESGTEGILVLGNVSINFDSNYMDATIDIVDISDNLQIEIAQMIVEAKLEYLLCYNMRWSHKPVVIDTIYLYLIAHKGEAFSIRINTEFHDSEDINLGALAVLEIEMPGYVTELKKIAMQTLVNNFFN